MAREYLELARTLIAPADAVWQALTDPQQLRGWWGPLGSTCTAAALDLRRGGRWALALRRPSGEEAAAAGEVLLVEPGVELHLSWAWGDDAPPSVVLIGLEDLGDRTRLHLRHEELPDEAAVEDHALGWMSALEGLARHLRARGGAPPLVEERTIAAPPALVAMALTRLAGLAAWWTSELEAGPDPEETDPEDEAGVGEVVRLEVDEDGALLWLRIEAQVEDELICWGCEGEDPDWLDTSISWELDEAQAPDGAEATRLRLVHDGLRSEAAREAARRTWAALLPRLQAHCEAGAADPLL